MTRRQKRGCALVAAGLCMVLAAAGLHLVQEQEDAMAGESSQVLLQQLELSRTAVPGLTSSTPEEPQIEPDMPQKQYLDYSMIGTIRVPSVGIELPILSTWSYDLLKVAPCRYSGTLKGGDLILMGHNYKSHFTPLHAVAMGDTVEFEDVNGAVYRFTVAEITILYKNDGEKLPSEYPLTLFTCSAGGQNRIVIRCAELEEA